LPEDQLQHDSISVCHSERSAASAEQACALRAPTAISVRIKSIRTEIAVTGKSEDNASFYTRSSIAHGWLFHPCAIDDPRGQLLVRATDLRQRERVLHK
jgi:hypothetical protein